MRPARIALSVGLLWLLAMRCLGGVPATAVATITAGFVTAITVTSGGSGYVSEPAVTLTGGGGSGATAKAVLSGDRVSLVIVVTAGSEYTSAPTVTIEAPPKSLGVRLELVPKLTVEGPAGTLARVESALALVGPWESWTNVTVGGEGTMLLDLRAGSTARFYRAVIGGPAGFVWIPPGTFVMGSPVSEAERNPIELQHTVTLTRGFWMSDHETTQAEYQAVMGNNPSWFKGTNLPVEGVSWNDAALYCQKLTERERAAGAITAQQEYRLPTEAEWEYAARAGTTGARHGELDAIGWWYGTWSSGRQTHPVRQKAANAWGLHDMIGNVSEWCADWYGEYPTGNLTDPMGPNSGSYRVYRGGSWYFKADRQRSACRGRTTPDSHNYDLGFRPALSAVR
jgi:formylglycine-generating enzyme required for sulfatase activity